eukprot:1161809-Pelagomonas_calceolata.AAC.13
MGSDHTGFAVATAAAAAAAAAESSSHHQHATPSNPQAISATHPAASVTRVRKKHTRAHSCNMSQAVTWGRSR